MLVLPVTIFRCSLFSLFYLIFAQDANKRVVPGQMGELVLEAHKLSMCQVSGLNGQPKTAQLCLRAHKTTLYHECKCL